VQPRRREAVASYDGRTVEEWMVRHDSKSTDIQAWGQENGVFMTLDDA